MKMTNQSYSDAPVVKDTDNNAICLASQIQRKVMLYPHQILQNCFILIDHNRPRIPLTASDVIVPVYPKKGDMIKVSGDDNEVWPDD